jgi:hypothetical protein
LFEWHYRDPIRSSEAPHVPALLANYSLGAPPRFEGPGFGSCIKPCLHAIGHPLKWRVANPEAHQPNSDSKEKPPRAKLGPLDRVNQLVKVEETAMSASPPAPTMGASRLKPNGDDGPGDGNAHSDASITPGRRGRPRHELTA